MSLTATGMPLHRQLFLVLRDQISSGALETGSALPSESELGQAYGVSRITVRRALQDLQDQGLVRKRPGRGTFVQGSGRSVAPQTMREGLQMVQDQTTVEVLEVDQRVAPAQVAAYLGLPDGSNVVRVLRVRRLSNSLPVMLTEAWLPDRFANVVTRSALRASALYEILETAGEKLGRVRQEISAVIADPVRAEFLEVEIGSALLRIDRLMRSESGVPIELVTVHVTPERSKIASEIAAIDVETAATGFLQHRSLRN
jgi:GntR family transcriptional regulator